MGKSDFIRLNVALKVPNDAAERAIRLSHGIAEEHKAFFILDGEELHPHITVYSTEYPANNRDKIFESLKNVSRRNKSMNLRFTDFGAEYGWIGINIKNSREILNLHKEVITELNPLRDGHIREEYGEPSRKHPIKIEFSPEQQENIDNYGHPMVMDLYKPHMTIIRLESVEEAATATEDLKWGVENFTATSLAAYRSGEHGTCRELIQEFSFV